MITITITTTTTIVIIIIIISGTWLAQFVKHEINNLRVMCSNPTLQTCRHGSSAHPVAQWVPSTRTRTIMPVILAWHNYFSACYLQAAECGIRESETDQGDGSLPSTHKDHALGWSLICLCYELRWPRGIDMILLHLLPIWDLGQVSFLNLVVPTRTCLHDYFCRWAM